MPEKPPKNSVTRRGFLLSSAAVGASLFVAGTSSVPSATAQSPRHSIMVDVSKCIACMRCVSACETYHREYEGESAKGTAYTKVAVNDSGINVPQLCLHCSDAPCTNVCITHALTQLDYGAVVFDRSKCIGCLLCVNQCPFGSITFNPVDRKIAKCVMCHKAVEEGKAPYCVKVCPTGARSFGLYEAKLQEGMKLAEEKQGVLLYPRDSGTLYALTEKEFQSLLNRTDVTVIKQGYPTESRWVADLMKFSRVAWIPFTIGAALYVAKWTKNQPSGHEGE
jgi:Fe-S-cluster-containing dehydrogenase component